MADQNRLDLLRKEVQRREAELRDLRALISSGHSSWCDRVRLSEVQRLAIRAQRALREETRNG